MREGSMPLRLDWDGRGDNGGSLEREASEESGARGREKLI